MTRNAAVTVERDPESGAALRGSIDGVEWVAGPDGSPRRADGGTFSPEELARLGDGIDPIAGVDAADADLDGIDLGQGATWRRADRDELFARLRAERPVSPQQGVPFIPALADVDWWAVTRLDDIATVSRHPELFASGSGGTNIGDIPPVLAEFLGSIINMDAPRHTKLRRLVSAGFTPRQVARLEDAVRTRAARIVDAIAERGSCDVVRDIAAPLPLQVICDMMGIPEEDEGQMFDWSNIILGFGDPEYVTSLQDLLAAGYGLYQYGLDLAERRRREPRDDIATALVEAEVDGEKLTDEELGSFFVLLVVAGNETTRTAISHGVRALTLFPDERRRWLADLEGLGRPATEEIVRWATPVLHFRRTTTEDVVLGGERIAEGDRVVMIYLSGNRDESHFTDPYRFDVGRTPNEHVAFGGGGPHFCLGANLARREIRVMFEELLRRLPDLTVTGDAEPLRSAFINGIKRMPAEFTPERA